MGTRAARVADTLARRKADESGTRWRIEAAFNRLKDFRRITARYDQTGPKLLGLCLSDRHSRMVDLFNESRAYS